jgi:hypothetical protein
MNIHFQQDEKRSQVFFYMLVALAVFTVSLLILNIGWHSEFRLSVPSSSPQEALMENSSLPVAVPAPLPPAEQLQGTVTPAPSATPGPLPQAIAAPVPDLP